MNDKHIDTEWFRRSFVEDNLAHWLKAMPMENGFFRIGLDRRWRPLEKQFATLVSQSRPLFVFATGYDVTGDESCLEAVMKGADFLLKHFRDTECGGWSWSVSPAGEPLPDERKSSYGYVCVIFGLAHAGRVTGEERFTEAAISCWEDMKKRLRYSDGGIKPGANRDFSKVRGANSQNPMMHLFEALLALYETTGSQSVFDDACELGDFIFTRLFNRDGGYLPEYYDRDWKPMPADKDGYIDLGHQIEWSFFLSRAVEMGFPQKYLEIGERLLDYGMRHGFDRDTGGVFPDADYDGRSCLRPEGMYWWAQCELLRTLMHYGTVRGRDDLWEPFAKSLAFVRRHFIDEKYGGWFTFYDPRGPLPDKWDHKGFIWKVGYHAGGMYAEAARLAEGNK